MRQESETLTRVDRTRMIRKRTIVEQENERHQDNTKCPSIVMTGVTASTAATKSTPAGDQEPIALNKTTEG